MSLGRRIGLVVATATVLVVSACGTIPAGDESATGTAPVTSPSQPSGASPDPSSTPASDLASRLPDSIRQAGKIVVGTDATRAPNEFSDGSTITGFDIDLFNAVAEKFGITAEYTETNLGAIVPGITARQLDIGVSSIPITAKRMQTVTMVSYFSAGTLWATADGNPKGFSIDSPCGLTVAVLKGTTQQTTDLAARQQVCGNRPIKIKTFDEQADVADAVVNGQADAMVADSTATGYAVAQSGGKLEAVGDVYDVVAYGYVLSPDEADFAAAIVEALQALKADGTYAEILGKWGVQAGAVDEFAVNPTV